MNPSIGEQRRAERRGTTKRGPGENVNRHHAASPSKRLCILMLCETNSTFAGQPPTHSARPSACPGPPFTSKPSRSRRRKSLETCPGWSIPAQIRDLTIARTRTTPSQLGHALQHPRSAIRQTHRTPPAAGHPRGSRGDHASTGAQGRRNRPGLLAARRRRTQIGQHDHPHQLTQKARERLALAAQQPRVDDPKRRADQPLSRQRRAPSPRTLRAALVDHGRQPRRGSPRGAPTPAGHPQRLHHTDPRQYRLAIEQPEDRPQAGTHPLPPRQALQSRRRQGHP